MSFRSNWVYRQPTMFRPPKRYRVIMYPVIIVLLGQIWM